MEARRGKSKTAHAWIGRSKDGDGTPIMRAACGLISPVADLDTNLAGTRQCGRCADYLPSRVATVQY